MLAWSSRIRDITARKQAEEAVARKEAQLKVALDNMPGALVYTNDDLNIVVCNDRFADMYPVPPELLQPGVATWRAAPSGHAWILRDG